MSILNKVADTLQVDVEILTKAINGEGEIQIPEGKFFTSEQLQQRDQTLEKNVYDSSRTTHNEMYLKDHKEGSEYSNRWKIN